VSFDAREGFVSDRFEAAVVAASKSALLKLLEGLPTQMMERGLDFDPFAPFTLEAFAAGRGRFIVFAWREGANRPDAWQEIEDLADEFSLAFGTAVAVHYDNMVGVRIGMLTRDGEAERYFGEEDEIWAPYGKNGKPVTRGPRYSANAIPKGVDCERIWDGIDAALEAAGFRKWLTAEKLHQVAVADSAEPVWKRLGVPKRRQRSGAPPPTKSKRSRTKPK
jgi:hypothetical protein